MRGLAASVHGLGARVERHERLVLVLAERVALESVAAGFGDRGDDGARGFFILGLEVLRDHAELLHRVLRKRIPPARVLSRDSARQDVVLEARAVDEDVDVVRAHGSGCDRLAQVRVVVANSGRERGEGQEVAVVLRELFDLLFADVRGDLVALRLDDGRLRRYRYGRLLARLESHPDVERLCFSDLYPEFLRHGGEAGKGDDHRVGPRLKLQVVEAARRRGRRTVEPRVVIRRRHGAPRKRAARLVGDGAPESSRRRLCWRRRHAGKDHQEPDHQ